MVKGLAFAIALAISPVLAAPVNAPPHTLPNPTLTPGVADPALTTAVICNPHWRTGRVRHVSAAEKRAVYRAYGIVPRRGVCAPKGCEVDHLISLEIGGSNAIKNLWPEPYAGPWNAHIKDKL